MKLGESYHEIRVEYQEKPVVCEKCGILCHKCMETDTSKLSLLVDMPESSARAINRDGEWTNVQGRNARRSIKGVDANEGVEAAISYNNSAQTPSDDSAGGIKFSMHRVTV